MRLVDRTARDVRDAIRDRRLSCEEVVRAAIDDIREADAEIRATTEIFEKEPVADARAIDRRLAAGEDAGPLAGVPFTAKDVMCTLVGHTTAASRILAGYRAPYEATAVRRMREAGAVLVAKTNMDEFAMGSSTENSGLHVTRNPWDLERVPGGSSGGAAALAGATGGMIHLGSDTGGSIRQPAMCCGVAGLKPTYGRVSRYGLLAYASSLDQIGPIATDAADCAIGLQAIAGPDPMDATTAPVPVPDYEAALSRRWEGVRIGVAPEYFPPGVEAEVAARVREAIETLAAAGARIEEVHIPHAEYAISTYYIIATAEASSNLARYDGAHYGHRSPGTRDIVELYSRSRNEGFGLEVKRRILLGTFVLSSGYYDAYYGRALKVRSLIREDLRKAFEKVDVILCPTSPVPAFRIGDRIDDPLALYAVDILTVSANLASIPAMSIPCGLTSEGLPAGLQILGRPFEDDRVLSVAWAYERHAQHGRRKARRWTDTKR
ncbi:MAG: Asp-tRNA(Asn)/Glu-tRNA(Gln) amidotransferase subunit GatA [Planctomycetes bacterium]|nr:Asp-tRNA(Asn)/Glu-tRNA(Gln) amidotransferase subunit GatA [Planctomycetota bacterium]